MDKMGGNKKRTNEREREGKKMFYNGLSANAKGWLLVKHHFAASSIIHQHVKGSAPISFSPTSPVYSFLLFNLHLPGRKKEVKSKHEEKKANSQVRRMTDLFTREDLCAPLNTEREREREKKHKFSHTIFWSSVWPQEKLPWFTLCMSNPCLPSCCKQTWLFPALHLILPPPPKLPTSAFIQPIISARLV